MTKTPVNFLCPTGIPVRHLSCTFSLESGLKSCLTTVAGGLKPQFLPQLSGIQQLFSRPITAASLMIHLASINLFAARDTLLKGQFQQSSTLDVQMPIANADCPIMLQCLSTALRLVKQQTMCCMSAGIFIKKQNGQNGHFSIAESLRELADGLLRSHTFGPCHLSSRRHGLSTGPVWQQLNAELTCAYNCWWLA